MSAPLLQSVHPGFKFSACLYSDREGIAIYKKKRKRVRLSVSEKASDFACSFAETEQVLLVIFPPAHLLVGFGTYFYFFVFVFCLLLLLLWHWLAFWQCGL